MKHLSRFISSKLPTQSASERRAPKLATWLALGAYLLCGALIVTFATPIFGWRALNVLTPSMKPHIAPGDMVLVHRVPISQVHQGDIITYNDVHQPGVTITHRVVGFGNMKGVPTVITKGDANQSADAPVPDGRVVGKVQTVVPGLGRVLGWLHSPLALILLIIIPGLMVIWSEIRRLRRLIATVPQTHAVRRLDGVYYRASALVVVLIALASGSTLAQLTATVSLNGNVFTVTDAATPTPVVPSPAKTPNPTGSPSPTATPCANITISNTAAGSTNTIHCSSTFSSRSSGNTSVSITSNSTQSATSGSIIINGNTVSGSGTPGSVTNNSSSSIDINVSQ